MVKKRKAAAEAMPAAAAAEPSGEQGEPSTSGSADPSKVVYIGHLPEGFFEAQMRDYFSQFGKVTKVRMSRSKKTGKSKHYAFLEFASAEVARISAEAMNNYMLSGQKLVAHVVVREEVHPQLFKGANRVFKKVPWAKIERERHNRERSGEEEGRRVTRALARDSQRQARIQAAGLDYEYEGLEAALPPRPKRIVFED